MISITEDHDHGVTTRVAEGPHAEVGRWMVVNTRALPFRLAAYIRGKEGQSKAAITYDKRLEDDLSGVGEHGVPAGEAEAVL